MKTAISLPDKIFHQAEQLAREQGMSRSELYKKAIEKYLEEANSRQAIIDSINRVCDEVDTSLDPELAAYTRRKLLEVEWNDEPIEHLKVKPSR
jgi:metal-responsive CopG/Arc/MetJ family transcriptional regulator